MKIALRMLSLLMLFAAAMSQKYRDGTSRQLGKEFEPTLGQKWLNDNGRESLKDTHRRSRHLIDAEESHKAISLDSSCQHILSWVPERENPALILQVVNHGYIDVTKNFIGVMEMNSPYTRDDMLLLCADKLSIEAFNALEIRCVPVTGVTSHGDIWHIRMIILSCLVGEGIDVLLSDSDALWLKDPMKDIYTANGEARADIIAQRGTFPDNLGIKWGSTICMGFAFFRGGGAGMEIFQRTILEHFHGDDQKAVNAAADALGVVWDQSPDYDTRLSSSTRVGSVINLPSILSIILLPHDKYTRRCDELPITENTVVAHCRAKKVGESKKTWMVEAGLWVEDEHPLERRNKQ